ncbi:MAG: cell division protein FtsQ/DivIB [Planctomycetota bacterium]
MKKNSKKRIKNEVTVREKFTTYFVSTKVLIITLVRGLPLTIVLASAVYAMVCVWENADETGRYVLNNPERILNSALPEGEIPRDLLVELKKLQNHSREMNILDPDSPSKMKLIYSKSPWVSDIYTFKRDFSNITIDADFSVRVPAAQVRYGRYYYSLDSNGMVLPGIKISRPDSNLPVIFCTITSQPEEGRPFGNSGLNAALSILSDINRSLINDRFEIKKLVVKNTSYLDSKLNKRNTLPAIDLYTGSGAFIKWGTSNASEAGEPDNLQKIDTIKKVLRSKGNFKSGDYLDVRTRTVYYSNSAMR